MASWRYSASSYTPRDRSLSRDSTSTSNYGKSSLSTPTYSSADRPSRWSTSQSSREPPKASRSNSIEEHGPVWAKTSLHSSPSSLVQKLKEKYSSSGSKADPTNPTSTSTPAVKRAEAKDLSLPLNKSYGRTTTSNLSSKIDTAPSKSYASDPKPKEPKDNAESSISNFRKTQAYNYTRTDTDRSPGTYSSRSSIRKRSPEPDKPTYEYRTKTSDYSPIENKNKIYTSSSLGSSPATARYLGKYSSSSTGSTPTTPTTPNTDRNHIIEKFAKAHEKELEKKHQDETVVLVTRGTSPTQPSNSVYVRTRRADSERTIERTATKPKIKPLMIDKLIQVEDLATTASTTTSSKYTSGDAGVRARNWTSYMPSTGSTYSPLSRYSTAGRASSYAPITISRYESSRSSLGRDIPSSRNSMEVEIPRKVEEPVIKKPPIVKHTDSIKVPSPPRQNSSSPGRDASSCDQTKSDNSSQSVSDKTETEVKTKTLSKTDPQDSISKPSSSSLNQGGLKRTVKTSPSSKAIAKSTSPPSKGEKKEGTKLSSSSSKSDVSGVKKLSSSPVIKKTPSLRDKSVSPASLSHTNENNSSKVDEKARSRSRTQDSDTNISVSGFSDDGKSNHFNEPTSVPKVTKQSPSPGPRPTSALKLESESESESESDETTTDTTDSETADEVEELTKYSEPSSIKRSITNFLQNLPNVGSVTDATSSRSRVNLFRGKSGSQNKIKFIKHVESGDRPWWMDSTSDVPDGVIKLAPSITSMPQGLDNKLLGPNFLLNRQFSRDKDWLKSSSEDVSERSPRPQGTPSPNFHQALSLSPTQQKPLDSTLFLDVPKFPVTRQWSDEKPWWITEGENSANDKSISVEKELSGISVLSEMVNGFHEEEKNERSSDKSISHHLDGEKSNALEVDGENIDVTPALRRRRELLQAGLCDPALQEAPDYQLKFKQELEESLENEKNKKTFLDECKLEQSVRDLTEKLAAVGSGLTSPQDEKPNILEAGDLSGMVSKAKAGLMKSTTRKDSLDQNSDDLAPKVAEVAKAEIDIYWKELVDTLDRPLLLCDLDFTDLTADDEKDIFGQNRVNGQVPPPPPLVIPNGPIPPPAPFNPLSIGRTVQPPPPPPTPIVKNKKTVKLFWREVTDAMIPNPSGSSLIWDEMQATPVDSAKLEHLFESRAKDLITKRQQEQSKTKEIVVLDHKRSNAINIGMTKLPPPRAIKAAILKMDSTIVTKEGIEKLLIMLPTDEERVRIEDAQLANPELPLGSAEQFLLTLASINELEARLKLWAFKLDFENSEKEICEPLQDLKQGIDILRSNRTFRGILSTLLSIGNFLNGQMVKGFQIDYLSKVPEVKDTVNKHSLLHHLCVFVMENFPDSTDLYSEIGPVTRASKTDFDELTSSIKKLEDDCKCSWNHLKIIAKHEGQTAMKAKMSDFLADCAERIILIGVVHRRIMSRFHKFILWLGVPLNRLSTTRPHELFKTVAEFALEYRTTRERILQQIKRNNHHREKSRSRASFKNHTADNQNHVASKKMNSKEAKEDAKLRQLLSQDASVSETTWKRTKKEPRKSVIDSNEDDNEILETLIKTANQTPSNRESLKERRRSRITDRKLCKSF